MSVDLLAKLQASPCYTSRFKKEAYVKRAIGLLAMLCLMLGNTASAQVSSNSQNADVDKQKSLWTKLESTVNDIDRNLDGVLGVAIEDLNTGQKFLLRADSVFPQASSIKIAVLAELYHQAQLSAQGASGKAKLTDLYTMRAADLVADSDIMQGLTSVDLRAVYSNSIIAHPAGILGGVDYLYTGRVEKVDTKSLHMFLNEGIIPVVPPIGFDGPSILTEFNDIFGHAGLPYCLATKVFRPAKR